MVQRLRPGDRAPDFALPSGDGHVISLKDLREKGNVVLYFYPKDESPGCTREACAFRDSYQQFKELEAEVIGVSSDSVQSHARFLEHHRLPFILLSDMDKKLRQAYAVSSNMGFLPGRMTFVIDKKGIVAYAFSSQSKPEKHVTVALKALKVLKEKPQEGA